jgi:hypothetical protein
MINNQNDIQNIDAYLSGKMSASEKTAFENTMETDPVFKQEIELQKDIMETLKAKRKAELMARLDSIDVSGLTVTNTVATAWKIAAGLLLTAGVLTGVYLYFNQNTALEPTTSKAVSETIKPIINPSVVIENKVANTVTTEKPIEVQAATKATKKLVKKEANQNAEAIHVALDHTPVTAIDSEFHTDPNIAMPSGDIAQKNDHINSETTVAVDSKSEYKFHYKHFNNKLFLYCNFDSKPYELIELNTKKTKELYLFFDKHYYELKSNQLEATQLKPIKQGSIVKQLELIRNKK